MEEAEQAELAEKMQQIKAGMSEKEIEEAVEHCRILHERQAAPDSQEALSSIPLLERSDIRREAGKTLTAKLTTEGSNEFCMYLPLQTK